MLQKLFEKQYGAQLKEEKSAQKRGGAGTGEDEDWNKDFENSDQKKPSRGSAAAKTKNPLADSPQDAFAGLQNLDGGSPSGPV